MIQNTYKQMGDNDVIKRNHKTNTHAMCVCLG